ncbi:DUF1192 domain-containing protein [Pacificimonas sp. WHA3]|uniref:DUF1192 domain-containing protein n=1 Tax=Pacificimonas pallii TaxID=2827236 RepID=A0ABS6SCB3_9SPHN|nr:DUF1192 domain-containing protein [Pacificimonas pallii]MBV7256055.1 DUF1192 domain-containing protein [Pacificimonas pallii]
MEEDDLPRPGAPLDIVIKEDLDRLSVHELEARVAVLEREISRTKARLAGARDFKSNADALFSKS